LGSLPSYVGRAFNASRNITVEFCLRAPRGSAATLLQLRPSAISLVLNRRGALKLTQQSRKSVSTAAVIAHPSVASGTDMLVRVVIDGAHQRVMLYVNGAKQESVTVRLARQTGVRLGNVAPVRTPSPPAPSPPAPTPPPSATNVVSLSSVTVSTSTGSVIPTPGDASNPKPSAGTSPGNGSGTSTQWPGNPFSPNSFWNAVLPDNAPIDSESHAYVNELLRQVKDYPPWFNTTSYSVPVYVVPADEPTQHVKLDTWGPDLQQQFDAVPIPSDAKVSAGTDKNMTIWQPSTDKMWDFFVMQKESDGWHARWGGEMDNVSSNPGYFTHSGQTNNWGASATGLPLLGGLVTFADLQRGYINHALAMALVETRRAYWSWPAQRTDGGSFTSGITPIPEGTRFRLDPSLNIDSLNLPPIDKMLAKAAQKYGIVVRDKAGAVVFYGQDPTTQASNPWPAEFNNQYPNNVLALFPWSHLQALQTQLSCCWAP
jgi:hypothetical protein